ncbi:MAG TPA: urease accessory protein UreF [Burkholderiales bacterium]|nr:urease accessory protein UreF [Burkholderiales bacterium]
MNLARLLQLASPALPVGAYSYSGGLEAAIESGLVKDAESAQRWIGDVLEHSVARMEAPLLLRMIASPDPRWNELFLASRESAELRAETVQMGYSLSQLLEKLGIDPIEQDEISYPLAYARAVRCWGLEAHQALLAYLWAWLENQVMAALKAVPLGQTDGQKILLALGARLEALAARAAALGDDELGNFAPGLAILSSRHETQYSRLFRS